MNDEKLIWEAYNNFVFEKLGIKHINRDGKRKARKDRAYQLLKQTNLSKARFNILKIKKELHNLGYKIIASDSYHTIRIKRIVGLSKPKLSSITKINKYELVLLSLAHEFGHVLQWDDSINKLKMFDFWFNKIYQSEDEQEKIQLKQFETMYYELDAWLKAKELLPRDIFNRGLDEIYSFLNSYKRSMSHLNFNRFPFLIQMAKELNYNL